MVMQTPPALFYMSPKLAYTPLHSPADSVTQPLFRGDGKLWRWNRPLFPPFQMCFGTVSGVFRRVLRIHIRFFLSYRRLGAESPKSVTA